MTRHMRYRTTDCSGTASWASGGLLRCHATVTEAATAPDNFDRGCCGGTGDFEAGLTHLSLHRSQSLGPVDHFKLHFHVTCYQKRMNWIPPSKKKRNTKYIYCIVYRYREKKRAISWYEKKLIWPSPSRESNSQHAVWLAQQPRCPFIIYDYALWDYGTLV